MAALSRPSGITDAITIVSNIPDRDDTTLALNINRQKVAIFLKNFFVTLLTLKEKWILFL